jgi:hypothetical protein
MSQMLDMFVSLKMNTHVTAKCQVAINHYRNITSHKNDIFTASFVFF